MDRRMATATSLASSVDNEQRDIFPTRRLALWAAIVLAGFLPLLIRFGIEQWAREQYEFFPLIIIAAAHLAWQRFREIPHAELSAGSRLWTRAVLGLALLSLVAASVLWSGRMAAISALIALAGVAWHAGGLRMLRTMLPSGILLAVVIGLPVGMDEPFLQALRELAVRASSYALVWLRVPHLITGTVIEIPGSRLLVAEACSGINSLMAVLGFTLVLGFWRRRSPGVIAGLVVAGVAFVLWANMVRIAGGVWLKSRHNIDVLSGDLHQWASLIMFAISMALIFNTDQLITVTRPWMDRHLRGWSRRRRMDAQRDAYPRIKSNPSEPPAPQPLVPAGVAGGLWTLAMCFALVGVAQVANAAARGGIAYWIGGGSARASLRADAAFAVPPQVANWVRSDAAQKMIAQPEIEGKQSQAWAYQRDGITAVVAIDYPFAGYHDLTVCYRMAGWNIQQELLNRPTPTEAFTTVQTARLGESGHLWYGLINESGEWIEPPKATATDRLVDRVRHFGRTDWNAPVYQVQVWVQAYTPLSEPQQQELSQLFLAVRRDLGQQVIKQLGAR